MKAQELRIGNWVYSNVMESEFQISALILTDKDMPSQPIPLTEKWLLDFGFDDSEGSDKYINKEIGFFKFRIYISKKYESVITRIDTADNEGEYHEAFTMDDIEYVHQLQNLYFALTGEELTPAKK